MSDVPARCAEVALVRADGGNRALATALDDDRRGWCCVCLLAGDRASGDQAQVTWAGGRGHTQERGSGSARRVKHSLLFLSPMYIVIPGGYEAQQRTHELRQGFWRELWL